MHHLNCVKSSILISDQLELFCENFHIIVAEVQVNGLDQPTDYKIYAKMQVNRVDIIVTWRQHGITDIPTSRVVAISDECKPTSKNELSAWIATAPNHTLKNTEEQCLFSISANKRTRNESKPYSKRPIQAFLNRTHSDKNSTIKYLTETYCLEN